MACYNSVDTCSICYDDLVFNTGPAACEAINCATFSDDRSLCLTC